MRHSPGPARDDDARSAGKTFPARVLVSPSHERRVETKDLSEHAEMRVCLLLAASNSNILLPSRTPHTGTNMTTSDSSAAQRDSGHAADHVAGENRDPRLALSGWSN
jgi:hypothetical protein